MAIYQENTDNVTRVLRPSNGANSTIDIINDYAWTLSPKSARETVPYVELIEYQQTTAQLLATLAYYYKQGKSVLETVSTDLGSGLTNVYNDGNLIKKTINLLTGNDFAKSDYATPYQNRYIATPTGFKYRMPYFDSAKFNRKTGFDESGTDSLLSWAGNKFSGGISSSSSGELKGTSSTSGIGNFIKGALNSLTPGKVGLLNAKTWSGTTENGYKITFDLLNTGTLEDINRNREFCYLITYQNSPSRRNFFITDPVVIYEMYIPDVAHFPACHIDGINITNLGNTQLIRGLTIPEAYRIEITITSLFDPSRNIMNGIADPSKKVHAILDTAKLEAKLQDIIADVETAGRSVGAYAEDVGRAGGEAFTTEISPGIPTAARTVGAYSNDAGIPTAARSVGAYGRDLMNSL